MNSFRQEIFRAPSATKTTVLLRWSAQVPEVIAKPISLAGLSGTAPHLSQTCLPGPNDDPGGLTTHNSHKYGSHTRAHTFLHKRAPRPTCTLADPTRTVSKHIKLEAGVDNCPYSPETTLVSASRAPLKPITSQSQANQDIWSPCQRLRLTDNKGTKGPLENSKDLQGDLEVLLGGQNHYAQGPCDSR